MLRITAKNKVNVDRLVQLHNSKEKVISEMLIKFAEEMHKRHCFEIIESNGSSGANLMDTNEREFIIEGFVMAPNEFKEVIKILRLIESELPASLKHHANYLYSIFTKEPFL